VLPLTPETPGFPLASKNIEGSSSAGQGRQHSVKAGYMLTAAGGRRAVKEWGAVCRLVSRSCFVTVILFASRRIWAIAMNFKRLTILQGLLLLGLTGGCQRQEASSDLSYSTLETMSYSILRQYIKAAQTQGPDIRYPLCVTAEFNVTDEKRARYLKIEEQAANKWNDLLQGEPDWTVRHIEFYMVGGATPSSCPDQVDGLKVYRLVALANQDRGYAAFHQYKNAIGRSEWDGESLNREIHEYGHQVGLGDTYTENSYQIPIGQPEGIMNNCWTTRELTEDDAAGVRNVWRMVRTNSKEPCGEGYVTGTARLNNNNHQFCIKDKNYTPRPTPTPTLTPTPTPLKSPNSGAGFTPSPVNPTLPGSDGVSEVKAGIMVLAVKETAESYALFAATALDIQELKVCRRETKECTEHVKPVRTGGERNFFAVASKVPLEVSFDLTGFNSTGAPSATRSVGAKEFFGE
jgi:hypothetical protein